MDGWKGQQGRDRCLDGEVKGVGKTGRGGGEEGMDSDGEDHGGGRAVRMGRLWGREGPGDHGEEGVGRVREGWGILEEDLVVRETRCCGWE